MTVSVYHNTESRFMPYEDGQPLVLAASHRVAFHADRDARAVAEWAFGIFNADLDVLETGRDSVEGETAFLAACVYRLLGQRSLSVGDVVHIEHEPDSQWLACDRFDWRPISEPSNCSGEPLTAARVYQVLARRSGPA